MYVTTVHQHGTEKQTDSRVIALCITCIAR